MKFLHTADWHLGKTLKGQHRLPEQQRVLAEIVDIARREQVDAILIAGDLYDTATPSADAQRLLWSTLLDLTRDGTPVLAIAGNHDHPGVADAYRPLAEVAGVHLLGRPRAAEAGAVHRFAARSTGEPVTVAMLPFLSQRAVVRAAEIVANTPAENVGLYAEAVQTMVARLSAEFDAGSVNVLMAHLTCIGGTHGGGERDAHSIFEYSVPPSIFDVATSYVALGHLHRRQQLPAAAPVHYSGSPIPIDFGEEENSPSVNVVEASPGLPAQVRAVPITTHRRLRTLTGTVEQLITQAQETDLGDDFVRVRVQQPSYTRLRDDVLAAIPNAIVIELDPAFAADVEARPAVDRSRQTPAELFADFCTDRGIDDPALRGLFAELYDVTSTPSEA